MPYWWAACFAAFLASFICTFVLVRFLIDFFSRRGIVGIDVHKPNRPAIPEMGGVGVVVGVSLGILIAVAMNFDWLVKLFAFLCVFWLASIIGVIDDLFVLRAKIKTLLTVLAFIPIIVFALLFPSEIVLGRPVLPFIGRLRLTIVYWLLLPFAIAVPSNAVNMMDVFNGVMSGCTCMASLALLIASIILGRIEAAVICSSLFGSLLAFYYYNRYPARIFSGDVGSLSIGAAIGAVSIIGGLEVVGVTVLMPFIMNAFHSLRSLGGLLERREISVRPISVGANGVLKANLSMEAPSTLANLFLRKGPATEIELVKCYHLMEAVSCVLAVIVALLMGVKF